MPAPARVVLNCAGEGRRLGIGRTKALVEVLGRPLIEWHLRMLRNVEDVVVVAGYQARELVEAVLRTRPDAAFAFNHDYAVTGTAASLARGALGAGGDVISLDGDLLVHPEDFRALLDGGPCIGVAEPTTSDAVYAVVGIDGVLAFNRAGIGQEWTGLLRTPAATIDAARADGTAGGHVFELLERHLPLPAVEVRAREIDTPDDYDRAIEWLRPIAHLW